MGPCFCRDDTKSWCANNFVGDQAILNEVADPVLEVPLVLGFKELCVEVFEFLRHEFAGVLDGLIVLGGADLFEHEIHQSFSAVFAQGFIKFR